MRTTTHRSKGSWNVSDRVAVSLTERSQQIYQFDLKNMNMTFDFPAQL
jgi:hypothetical protein